MKKWIDERIRSDLYPLITLETIALFLTTEWFTDLELPTC